MKFHREDICLDNNNLPYRAYICKDNSGKEYPVDVMIAWLNINVPYSLHSENSILPDEIIKKN